MNWKLRKAFTGNNTSDVQTINGYIAAGEDNDFSVEVSPVGKEYPAPLVVPRTNLLLQSNQFDTTWINNLGVIGTISDNQNGYDGTNDAWLLSKSAAFGRLDQTISSSGVQTYSLYAKANDSDWIYFRADYSGGIAGGYFNLATGIGGSFSNIIDSDITSVGNGWYRIQIVFNQTISIVRIYPAENNNQIAGISGSIYIQDAQLETADKATEYIPTTTEAVTRSWDSFSRVQNQVPGICNGTHTHTGAASGGGIAATTLTGTGSGGKFKYEFDTLGKLVLIEATDAGQGYRVDDKLSITTNEGHDIEFRLVEGSNATTVTVGMEATKPSKPVPFPVSKMRVEGLTDRRVLIMDQRSRYVFPKPTPYLLDTYEGAAAAYSLRRLRSAYTGPAVRVRRASNNDELDIYFDGQGNLDTASLEAFCAGTDGFVKVWYDQGQGGNDATQGATGAQPKIVSSGSVVTKNGKPAIQFDGSDDTLLANHTDLYGQTRLDIYMHYQSSDNVLIMFSDNSNGSRYSFVAVDGDTSTTLSGNYGSPNLYANGTQVSITSGVTTRDDLHTALITNAASTTAGTLEVHENATSSSWPNFGISNYGGAFKLGGKIAEIILYNSDQSANRQGIEDNINDFYNIY